MRKEQVFIVCFEFVRDQLEAVGQQHFKTREKAIERAEDIAEGYAGVGVYGVWVDDITYDASDLVLVHVVGETPDLEQLAAAA